MGMAIPSLHLRKTLEDSLLRQGHSGIRNGEPKHPVLVVQEGRQKNFGSIGIRNDEHNHPAVLVSKGWQRNISVVNKGKEIILEFQILKIPNSSGNLLISAIIFLEKKLLGLGQKSR